MTNRRSRSRRIFLDPRRLPRPSKMMSFWRNTGKLKFNVMDVYPSYIAPNPKNPEPAYSPCQRASFWFLIRFSHPLKFRFQNTLPMHQSSPFVKIRSFLRSFRILNQKWGFMGWMVSFSQFSKMLSFHFLPSNTLSMHQSSPYFVKISKKIRGFRIRDENGVFTGWMTSF